MTRQVGRDDAGAIPGEPCGDSRPGRAVGAEAVQKENRATLRGGRRPFPVGHATLRQIHEAHRGD